jgi:D-tagatose-1,6-bisphosphate aldolase subunit GatZ/KbaZ
MALVAEEAYARLGPGHPPLRYVIGTEVPPPGGMQGGTHTVRITPPDEVSETIEVTRGAFLKLGLGAAWERVIAVVVQPGVEYGDVAINDYDPVQAAGLARLIETAPGLVYEAHSTDYQTRTALRRLVEDHFAILKVGPALTFAFREAVFALAMLEEEWMAGRPGIARSGLRETLDQAMQAQPIYWRKYYPTDPTQAHFARKYSLSDRSRYYWPDVNVQRALGRLLTNLQSEPIPLPLLSQFMPVQARRLRDGLIDGDPHTLIMDHITETLADYTYACTGT